MGLNLLSFLSPIANSVTGFQAGQQQGIRNDYINSMDSMQLQNAQNAQATQQSHLSNLQAASDAAMGIYGDPNMQGALLNGSPSPTGAPTPGTGQSQSSMSNSMNSPYPFGVPPDSHTSNTGVPMSMFGQVTGKGLYAQGQPAGQGPAPPGAPQGTPPGFSGISQAQVQAQGQGQPQGQMQPQGQPQPQGQGQPQGQMQGRGQGQVQGQVQGQSQASPQTQMSAQMQGTTPTAAQLASNPGTALGDMYTSADPRAKQFIDYSFRMSQELAKRGEPGLAQNYAVQAMNATAQMYKDNQMASAGQAQEYKRAMIAHGLVASTMGAVPNTGNPAVDAMAFDQARQAYLQSGMGTPQEDANIRGMTYSPQLVASLRNSGMNSYQQNRLSLESQSAQDRNANNATVDTIRMRGQDMTNANAQASLAARTSNAKVGLVRSPTTNDLSAAEAALAPEFTGGEKPPKDLIQTVASRTLALGNVNRGSDSVGNGNKVVAGMKANGELVAHAGSAAPSLFGLSMPGTGTPATHTFTPKGTTSQSPISFTGQDPSSRIPGLYYKGTNGRITQWGGPGWIPVKK